MNKIPIVFGLDNKEVDHSSPFSCKKNPNIGDILTFHNCHVPNNHNVSLKYLVILSVQILNDNSFY